MTTEAISGFGTLLQIGNGQESETFTTVAEVRDITGPSMSMDTIDVTNHGSTSAWREFIASVKDAGEVSFDILFVPTGTTHRNAAGGLLYTYVNRTKRNWQLVFPDTGSTTWSFSGFITSFETQEPVEDALSASVTIKLTGAPTLAYE